MIAYQHVLTILIFMIPLFSTGQNAPTIGAEAPRIDITLQTGETVALADLYAKGPVLLYFYPKSFTPGCTQQACDLRDNFADLQKAELTVFGVSKDSVEKQAKFKEEYALPFDLVADPEGLLGKAFKVGAMGGLVYRRQTVLIIEGKIAWFDPSAKPKTQTTDALAALEKLQK